MNKIITKTLLVAGLFSAIILASCKEDNTAMGIEIKNPGDKILVSHDSSTLISTYTYEMENIINSTTSNLLLGCQNDPELGTFYNHAMVEFTPDLNSTAVDTFPVAESLILTLQFYPRYTIKYDTVKNADGTVAKIDSVITYYSYGDVTTLQKLLIYEIDTTKPITNLNGQEFGDLTLNGYYDETKRLAELDYQIKTSEPVTYKIPLSLDLAKRLIENYKLYSTSFNKSVFRGMYFKSQEVNGIGAIASVLMNDSSKMELTYHTLDKNGKLKEDSLKFTYTFKTANKVNLFEKKLNQNLVYNPMYTELENAKEDPQVYVKNNNALYLKVHIQSIEPLRGDTNVAINLAELRLPCPQLEGDDTLFRRNDAFYAYLFKDNKEYFLYNHTVPSSTSYSESPIYINKKNYISIYLTDEFQTALDKAMKEGTREEMIIHIKGAYDKYTPNRTIFNGAKYLSDPVKLYITYTTVNPL